MPTFLKQIAQTILHLPAEEKITLIFPGQRAGIFLVEELQKELDKPFLLPEILGIEDFIQKTSGLKIISKLETLFIFYEVYSKENGEKAESFDEFMSWGTILLEDFDELDRQAVDPQEIFTRLHEIRQIDSWGDDRDKGPSQLQRNFRDFWMNASRYYNLLKKELTDSGFAYSGLAFRVALEKIDNLIKDKTQFFFAGFNALSRSEEMIIQKLLEENKSRVYWDMDTYYLDDTNQEAGLFLRSYLKKWNIQEVLWKSDHFANQQKEIEIISVAQNSGQVRVAGEILQKEINPLEGRTAVVLADENLLIPLLQSIPESYESINVTMGYPLTQAPMFDLFYDIFKLKDNDHPKKVYFRDLFQVINNKYVDQLAKYHSVTDELNQFREDLIKGQYVQIDLLSFQKQLSSFPILLNLSAIQSPDALLEYLLDLIVELKNYISTKGGHGAKYELEFLFAFHKLINKLLEAVRKSPNMFNFRVVFQIFHQLAAKETADFKGEPLEGLQIMGVLETRNLDFENIILISANEGTIPKGKMNQSFIPHDIKREYHIPTFKDRDAIYAYHFYHLIQRAQKSFLIYTSESDDFGSGEKSRYIQQIENEMQGFPNIELKSKTIQFPVNLDINEGITVKKNPAILKRINSIREKGFSPSALSTYIECPLNFYYKYILGLKEEEEMVEDIESSVLGSVIHGCLEDLMKPFTGKVIGDSELNEMKERLDETVRLNFLKEFHADNLKSGKNYLSMEVVRKYLRDYLTAEKGNFELLGSEMNLSCEIKNNGQSYMIRGQIDRYESEGLKKRIVDYKSGKVTATDLSIKSIEELKDPKNAKAFQLMTYALLASNALNVNEIEAGIISFRNSKEGLINLRITGDKKINDEIIHEFESVIGEIIEEISDPEMPFNHRAQAKYCEYCGM